MAKLCLEEMIKKVAIPFSVRIEEGENPDLADAKGRGLISLLLAERFDVFIGRREKGIYRFIVNCLNEKMEETQGRVEKLAKLKGLKVDEKDKCVFCGEETEYTKDIPIHQRKFYVEGAGQLCGSCYEKIYRR